MTQCQNINVCLLAPCYSSYLHINAHGVKLNVYTVSFSRPLVQQNENNKWILNTRGKSVRRKVSNSLNLFQPCPFTIVNFFFLVIKLCISSNLPNKSWKVIAFVDDQSLDGRYLTKAATTRIQKWPHVNSSQVMFVL